MVEGRDGGRIATAELLPARSERVLIVATLSTQRLIQKHGLVCHLSANRSTNEAEMANRCRRLQRETQATRKALSQRKASVAYIRSTRQSKAARRLRAHACRCIVCMRHNSAHPLSEAPHANFRCGAVFQMLHETRLQCYMLLRAEATL